MRPPQKHGLRPISSLCVGMYALGSVAQGAEIQWIGDSGLWTTPSNWAPILEGDPPVLIQRVPGPEDVAILSDTSTGSSVRLSSTNQALAVGGLTMQDGVLLQTDGSRIAVANVADVRGAGTNLHVVPFAIRPEIPAFEAGSLVVSDRATVFIEGDPDTSRDLSAVIGDVTIGGNATVELDNGDLQVNSVVIGPQGTLSGKGRMRIASTLINEGTISVGLGAPPRRRTLWLEGLPGAMIDLDGPMETGSLVVDDGTDGPVGLRMTGSLADPFNGDVQIGRYDSLSLRDIAHSSVVIDAWGTLSVASLSNATVQMETGTTLDVGTVSGASTRITSRVTSTGLYPIISGNTHFQEGVLEVHGSLNVIGNLDFDSAARLDLTGADTLILDADPLINEPGEFAINQSAIDLDGESEDLHITVRDGSLVLDVGAIDDNDDGAFDGTLSFGGFGLRNELSVNIPGGWVSRGTISIRPSESENQLTGSPVTIDGALHVSAAAPLDTVQNSRDAEILADATFTQNADVRIHGSVPFGAHPVLILRGRTIIGGGTWLGQNDTRPRYGSLVFDSPRSTIVDPTTMTFSGIDLDGREPGSLLDIQKPLTLNVSGIAGNSPVNDGTVRIGPDGKLEVNFPPDGQPQIWFAKNRFELVGGEDGSYREHLAGTAVQIHGNVDVSGHSAWSARAEILGTVELADAARLRLDGGDTHVPFTGNRILGGTIRGPGPLEANSGHGLTGFGRVEAAIAFDRTDTLLAAHLGTLTLSGPLLSAGMLGTSNVDATLRITQPWNTSVAEEVFLDRGTLNGADVTNDGVLRGRGSIRAVTIDNQGLIETTGANLILGDTLTINTRSRPDLDGSGPHNGEGTIRVHDGHLVVSSDADADFHGTLEVGGGYSFSLTHAGAGLRIAAGDEDPDGSGDAGRVALENGKFRGAFFRQASQLAVLNGGGVVEASDIEFESSAQNLLDGDLVLRGNSTVHAAAAFSGGGRLVNADPFVLSFQPGADLGVSLHNDG